MRPMLFSSPWAVVSGTPHIEDTSPAMVQPLPSAEARLRTSRACPASRCRLGISPGNTLSSR